MFEVKRYCNDDRESWNRFVATSRQGTFLFNRSYMDYHRSRFHDHSLLFYRHGQLFALLPANIDRRTLWSHGGLTYGGLLTNNHATTADVIDMFATMNAMLKAEGITTVVYKPMPWIYQRQPSQEDLYALTYTCHATLTARYISSSIKMADPVKWRYGRKYDANKAEASGITIEQDNDAMPDFWDVLDNNLAENHNTKPVHTLEEMRLLQAAFPENIKLYVAKYEGAVVAGSVVYVTPQVVHTQYISANGLGKRLHALDLLFRKVFEDFKDAGYFDFGNSNEEHGRVLNSGLAFQKEGFGGRGVCYDWYEYYI